MHKTRSPKLKQINNKNHKFSYSNVSFSDCDMSECLHENAVNLTTRQRSQQNKVLFLCVTALGVQTFLHSLQYALWGRSIKWINRISVKDIWVSCGLIAAHFQLFMHDLKYIPCISLYFPCSLSHENPRNSQVLLT